MRAALLTLHGFVTTYTGWADLGMSIAAMIGAALSNIDWVQAAGDLSALAIGILTAINTGLAQIDWGAVGQTVLGMLSAIDWAGVFGQLGQLFANLWPVILTTVVLPAILSWISSVLLAALGQAIVGSLATWFSTVAIPAVLSGIGSALSAIVTAIGGWPVVLIAAIVALFAALIAVIVDNWDAICDWFSGAWDSFVAAWNEFWSLVSTNARNWWNDVTTGWSNFWATISEKFNALKSALGSAWNSFWSGLASGVTSIWNGIVNTVKGAVNALIGFINGMLSGIVNGLNGAIDVLNRLSIDVPSWVPLVGGNHLGFSVSHITAPQIPYLAQGAVIPPNPGIFGRAGRPDQRHQRGGAPGHHPAGGGHRHAGLPGRQPGRAGTGHRRAAADSGGRVRYPHRGRRDRPGGGPVQQQASDHHREGMMARAKTDCYQIDGQPMLAPDTDASFSFSDLDASDSGRTEDGVMHRIMVRQGVGTWGFAYAHLTDAELAYMESLFARQGGVHLHAPEVRGQRRHRDLHRLPLPVQRRLEEQDHRRVAQLQIQHHSVLRG